MSLYSSNGGVTDDDRALAIALREKGSPDLASIAERNEIMRRFHNGLSSGLSKDEARNMLKGMVACVKGESLDDLDAWIMDQSIKLHDDLRWKDLQALILDHQQSLGD